MKWYHNQGRRLVPLNFLNGLVTRLRLVFALLLLPCLGGAEPYCRLKGFQDHGAPSLGGSAIGDRVHFNTLVDATYPWTYPYMGMVTCAGIADINYPLISPFDGGIQEHFDTLVWPPLDHMAALELQVPLDQKFPATLEDGLRITTRLEFVPEGYYLTRFLPQEGAEPDTSYLDAQVFHAYPAMPVLWIEGVSQVEGVVGQSVTIVSEDSLYITGDLIVEGTRLSPCGDPETFGMTPEGSEILVGLIGFHDVIVAATLENGAANGVQQPSLLPCGLDHSPVVTTCNQRRSDIIITASIMALVGRFIFEYWITSIDTDLPSVPYDAMHCGDNPGIIPHGIPGCDVDTGFHDIRGTVWFCGSLAQDCGGMLLRDGHYGSSIGYVDRHLRYDSNLLHAAPPCWPDLEWVDEDPPIIQIFTGTDDFCGQGVLGREFRALWQEQGISLHVSPNPGMQGGIEPLVYTTWLDGVPVETVLDTLVAGSTGTYVPRTLLPHSGMHVVYMTVGWDSRTFNADGAVCKWVYNIHDPYPPALRVGQRALELCDHYLPWPELLEHLQSDALWADFHAHPQCVDGLEPVSLFTYTEQGLLDSLAGFVMAGETVRMLPTLANLQGEPEFVAIEIRWDGGGWNRNGSECRWYTGTVSIPRHELQPQPTTLALRIAPNPANPIFTIEFEVPVAGETSLELYDLRGRKVQTLVSGPQSAGSHRVTVDLGPGASGLYFVRLLTPAGQRVEKVLVLR